MVSIVYGANGAMGKLLCEMLGDQVIGRVSRHGENGAAKNFDELGKMQADVVIDFSHHSAVGEVLDYAQSIGAAAVIGTTGHTEEEKALVAQAAKNIPVFFAGNMSLGVAVLCRLAREAASYFPEANIEIVEIHHTRKVDAPSGTALMIYDSIRQVRPEATAHCGRAGEGKRTAQEIGISSLRMGNVVGTHEVYIHTGNQCLTLKHEAVTRQMLADGVMNAIRFIVGKPAGLYGMDDMLG